MSDFNRNVSVPRFGAAAGRTQADIDQGLRAYMLRVYNYMTLGLAITGAAALGIYMLSVSSTPTEYQFAGIYLTQFGATLFGSPLRWVVMFAPLAAVLFLSFRVDRLSVGAAQSIFWVYAALVGVSLASIFLVYTHESIVRVFFITAAAFGGLSLYGYTTSRSLSGLGSFLIMGLIGILVAMVVNIFLASTMLQFIISVVGVLVFAGLTAYDTQRIKEMYFAGDDDVVAGRKAIMGALTLYLDFINMFLMLLQLFGNRNN
ncbi:Bax inhibitor-1/YccA family protein [Ancylobacter dichloromethanicus]|uniref:Membrane protein n=1 Tax=Ancylobacter dichloromethanicus TaxID=518825 RepID=A0A9W6JCJ2_9HYPH|nr:Bax inhibitor-1/YccA family protein [Ancylobacter dichloromethanicus]MBS7553335.1 Bax inhibitor-1/YccA family protein [Ancylobacter dichloromethanicus]GLK73118.1 membrane protein [Ancylobacter dichloromethanicus]